MPYCPKCDMEFIDGITVCTDCGGPLVESEEAAKAMRKEEEARKAAEYAAFYAESEEDVPDDSSMEQLRKLAQGPVGTYVTKSRKYDDLKSSASAFMFVGAILLAAAALCWFNIISLPAAGISLLLFKSVLTFLGAGSLLVAAITLRSAKNIYGQIGEEERTTKEIIDWFISSYDGSGIDQQLHAEFPGITPDELNLKRFELIKDLLITNRDIPDEAYADSLCEEIYSRFYE